MMKLRFKSTGYLLLALTALVLFLTNLYIVKVVDDFGSPTLFAIAILFQIILIAVFLHSIFVGLKKPRQVIWSVALSILTALEGNEYIQRLTKNHPAALRWLQKRLDKSSPTGITLSLGLISATILLVGFLSVLQDVLYKDPFTKIDIRVVNLIPAIRTSLQTHFFSFITFIGNWETMGLIVVTAGFILLLKRQRLAAATFAFALLVEEGSSFALKHLVGRVRPEQALSLIREDSFSFPSGHVMRATVLLGVLAYFIYKSFRSSLAKLAIGITYITAVFLVALSRIYLGVHYPSDVLASTFYGGFLLVIFITAMECLEHHPKYRKAFIVENKFLILVPALALGFAWYLYPHFIKIQPLLTASTYQTIAAIDEQTIQQIPLFSETLTGKHMEPINFVYIGSQQQIENRFLTHGWYKADPSTLTNTLRALSVGYQDGQYLHAPVTPSYLSAKPEDVAFEKPTASNTLRQRHHTRLWRTDFRLGNDREVWVATASFDEGTEFAGAAKLPTHHINPNIDAERRFITLSLGDPISEIQVVPPQEGKNASADTFFTDGKAEVIYL
jgi:membrane-associated phospholipid phosphatase